MRGAQFHEHTTVLGSHHALSRLESLGATPAIWLQEGLQETPDRIWDLMGVGVPSMPKHHAKITKSDESTAFLCCPQAAEGLRAQQPWVWSKILLGLEQPTTSCQKQQCLNILVSRYPRHRAYAQLRFVFPNAVTKIHADANYSLHCICLAINIPGSLLGTLHVAVISASLEHVTNLASCGQRCMISSASLLSCTS